MKFTYSSIVCAIGLGLVLVGCDSGPPEADSVNCSGRGMEKSLTAFKGNEVARQAFIDKCAEINKGN